MKKNKVAVVAVLAAVVGAVFWAVQAGNLEPPGPPAPTDRSTIFQVDMLPSGLIISTPGSYVVMENLTGVPMQNGITVDADDVTIDLNGFTLAGGTGSLNGISVGPGISGTTVKNGTVTDWDGDGINLDNTQSSSSLISDILAIGNDGDGIVSAQYSVIRGCTATANGGDGIHATNGSTMIGCVANKNTGNGISAGASVIENNTSTTNDGAGILLNAGSVVRGNVTNSNLGAGIHVVGAHNRIEGNHLVGNAAGIDVDVATKNVIVRNTVVGPTAYTFADGNWFGKIIVLPVAGGEIVPADAWVNFRGGP